MLDKASITNFSRGSFHDGPGIRTVVYFNGCSLNCKWCHNPETISHQDEILYVRSKCIKCGKCIEVCPKHHVVYNDDMLYIRAGCTKCGKCADVCPSGALNVASKGYDFDYIMKEIRKDIPYYNQSGGGVTFSGGECLLHIDLLEKLLKKCKEENIHTCIESAFHVPFEHAERAASYVDFIFADLKIPNSEKHKEFTGKGNELIIDNIRKISNIHNNITIRIPMIPAVNDEVSDIIDFARIINTFGEGIKGVELLKYNYLAESKYELMDKKYYKFGDRTQDNEKMDNLVEWMQKTLERDIPVYYRKG